MQINKSCGLRTVWPLSLWVKRPTSRAAYTKSDSYPNMPAAWPFQSSEQPATSSLCMSVACSTCLSAHQYLPVSASPSFRWRVWYKPALVLLEGLFSLYGDTVKLKSNISFRGFFCFVFFFGGVCENKLVKKKEADAAWQRFRFAPNQSWDPANRSRALWKISMSISLRWKIEIGAHKT